MIRDWRHILLRDYRPEPMVRVPQHEVLRAAFPVIDAHNHLGRPPEASSRHEQASESRWRVEDVGRVVALMDDCNVEAIVNLDGYWGGVLEANLDRYDRAHPGRFVTFCRLDWRECGQPGWPDRLANSVRESASRGARGLKVWKNLGLWVHDENGKILLPDDARIAPVWEAAREAGLPVLIHVADPPAFFEPLSEHNERLEELLLRPDWHWADPRYPRFETLLGSLERLVATNPKVTFIGAHVGCNVDDLAWVARMLDAYPNFYVDVAARIADLGRQPRATTRLILAHPGRVLFGTDASPPTSEAYARHFRFFETDDECVSPGGVRWTISSIDLPADVLADVYGGNARRIIPALRTT